MPFLHAMGCWKIALPSKATYRVMPSDGLEARQDVGFFRIFLKFSYDYNIWYFHILTNLRRLSIRLPDGGCYELPERYP